MSRREQREQIFKILFGVEFHSAEELDEQIAPVNRTVKLLDLSSDTAKSILAME